MDNLRSRLQRHAIPFLARLLHCSYPEAWSAPLSFQTFDDQKPEGEVRRNLATILHGSLDHHAEALERLNQAGAGVFITVNETDGHGRKKPNMVRIRAWWCDVDEKDADEPLILGRLPLAPSMVVCTPGGWHLDWLALMPMPCETPERQEQHEAEVKGMAKALAAFGGDTKACDVARVLRLPGFLHRKAEPCMVELVHQDGPAYDRDQVRAAFPAIVPDRMRVIQGPNAAVPVPRDRRELLERAARYLDAIPSAVSGQRGHDATFIAALKIQDGFDLSEEEALSLLLDRFNPRCEPPWTEPELRHKVKDAAKTCMNRGHLLAACRKGGHRA